MPVWWLEHFFFWRLSFFGSFNKKMGMLWENNSYIIPFSEGYELQNSARDSPLLVLSPRSSLIRVTRSTAALLHEYVWGAGESAWEKPQSRSQLLLPLLMETVSIREWQMLHCGVRREGLVVTLWMFLWNRGWWCAEMIHCGLLWG